MISIAPETRYVSIDYTTSPTSIALQWLRPEQTFGKKKPFLYSHSEPIYARSWIPCQDNPVVRLTYRATIKAQPGMVAVMSATNPRSRNAKGVYELDMPQPIPPYLIALAVGDLEFKPIGRRTGVYAEPSMVARCAREFENIERVVAAAESLWSPYRWGRYDILVLPPAYPLGGMENPRLTFVSPSIVAGDRSLTDLIVHELCHSWAGDLVTNGTWNDIWLNEGIATYLERRVTEAVQGPAFADMISAVGRHELDALVTRLGQKSQETQLYLDMSGRNPDSEGREIVYEKGFLFFRAIEEAVGRRWWDAFLRTYFDRFAYQSITTTQFLAYYRTMLAGHDSVLSARVDADDWVYGQGIPASAPSIRSQRLLNVDAQLARWQAGTDPRPIKTVGWSTWDWVHFLQELPDTLTASDMGRLDIAFGFTGSPNAEILSTWLLLAVRHNYQPAFPKLQAFLRSTGRISMILPLYRALVRTEDGATMAREIFARARASYHPLAERAVSAVLGGPAN